MKLTRDKQFYYVGESIPNNLGGRAFKRESGEAFHAATIGVWQIFDDAGVLQATGAMTRSADGMQYDLFIPYTTLAGLPPGDYLLVANLENPVTGFSRVVDAYEFALSGPEV